VTGPETGQEWQPGRWWRVVAPEGDIWCETSDEDEAREALRRGDRLERLYVRTDRKWVAQ